MHSEVMTLTSFVNVMDNKMDPQVYSFYVKVYVEYNKSEAKYGMSDFQVLAIKLFWTYFPLLLN